MTKWRRYILLLPFVLVAGLYLLLPVLSRSSLVRRRVELAVLDATRSQVSIGDLSVGYDLALHLHAISAAAPGQAPFVEIETAAIRLSPTGWRAGQPFNVRLTAPHLFVDRLPSAGSSPANTSMPLHNVTIEGGFLHIGADKQARIIGPLNLTLRSAPSGATAQALDASLELDPGLPPVALTGALQAGDDGAPRLQPLDLKWSGVPLSALARLGFAPEAGTTIDGELDVTASAAGPLNDLQVSGSLRLTALHYQTAQTTIDKLEATGTFDGNWDPAADTKLHFDISADRGEVLWDTFYLDLAQHAVHAQGDVRQTDTAIHATKLGAEIAGLGSVSGSGDRDRHSGDLKLSARISIPQLSQLYTIAVRDPYQDRYPFLTQTSVRGALSARTELRRTAAGSSLKGELKLTDVTLAASKSEIELRGLNLDLPLQLGRVGKAASQPGRLRFSGMNIGKLEFAESSAALAISPNAIALAEPLRLPLLGGQLVFSDLSVRDLASAQPHASLAMALQALDLATLAQTAGWPALSGTISGAIPRMTLIGSEVRSEGEIRVQGFGGNIAARNLRVDQLFSSVPTLGMDLDFDDISLGRLTEILAVGRITGVMHGTVRNLAIVGGEPISFDAWAETVSTSGVAQRISVTAIGQLSILGGSGGDPLSQSLFSFFDEYRYSKMGFRCRLENDTFLLQGVESKDGQEYLVVGGFLPPHVNVISHNQTIAFSEMVRRLRRVVAETKESGKDKETKNENP